MARRPSLQTVLVLRALAADPMRWRHGYDLGREVGLRAGSLYPILMRLADRGWLESRWERDPESGRPPRHLYRVTGEGQVALATAEASAGQARMSRPIPRSAW